MRIKHPFTSLFSGRDSTGRQASFVVFGDGVTFAMLFVTAMVLARIISKEDMGTYRQVLFVGTLLISIVELGISFTIYRFLPFFKDSRKKVFLWDALVATTSLSLLASVVMAVLAFPLAMAFHNRALGSALLITACYPLAIMPFRLVRPVLICLGHSLKATFLDTLFALFTALAVILPLMADMSLNQALIFWILANLFRLPVTAWYMGRELRGTPFRWDPTIVREIWAYIWPIQVSRFPGIAFRYFDKVLTSVLFSTDTFAAYSLGARELPFLNQIPFSVSSVLIPRMVESFEAGEPGQVCTLWRKACVSTAIVTYLFAAFAIWYAQPIIRVLFTSAYDESAIPFGVFAAITFIRVINYGSLAQAVGKTRIIMHGATITMLISLPVSFVMAYFWGIWGISLSLLVSTSILTGYYLMQYRVLLKCRIREFYPIGTLIGIAVLAMSAVVISAESLGRALEIRRLVDSFPLALRLGAVFSLSALIYVSIMFATYKLKPDMFAGLTLPKVLARNK